MAPPMSVAAVLAGVYGRRIDRHQVYTQGVALSGRLRLADLDGSTATVSADVAGIVAPVLADPSAAFDPATGLAGWAGVVWAEEMYRATDDARYRDLLVSVCQGFDLDSDDPFAAPLDRDRRVEDMFFASALLGRALALTADPRFAACLGRYLLAVDTQQADGLYWHCRSSPFYWGRGNGFAALGLAEALTYLPRQHPAWAELLARHRAHLQSLQRWQDASGMWRQVVDRGDAYLEHSATSMIACALARGIAGGWLAADEWTPVLERAWAGLAERVGPGGDLAQVCVGTGPLADLDQYLNRAHVAGTDDRGGALALWCAVEMERLRRSGSSR